MRGNGQTLGRQPLELSAGSASAPLTQFGAFASSQGRSNKDGAKSLVLEFDAKNSFIEVVPVIFLSMR